MSHHSAVIYIHNHLVVDALLAFFPFGSDEFVRLRDLYWLSAFRAAAAVTAQGGRVSFVALRISPEEQEARIENADRRKFNKLADRATLMRLRRDGAGARPALPTDLTIDTDASPAEATAAMIQATFDLVPVEAHTPYPE